ncbi:PQQ-dependent sugar dehydrogenase [Flavobacteriaceae bacterium]|nr:PQQ-dependent sugar dehydrogenase [Flavobacteriaceae bacterium]
MKNTLLLISAFFCLNAFSQTIELEDFADGFSSPLALKNAGDERLFVVEQGGVIKIVDLNGVVNTTPFLDIQSIVNAGGERGLLGLAFHPEYQANGRFFVHYSNSSGDTQISEFSVSTSNPDIANPNSEVMLLTVSQPFSNHNGGTIAFGPQDGYLYIGLGDGGGGGDTNNNAQNPTLLIGKLLRIDIDTQSDGNNYGIPSDNPFIGDPNTRDEIWALGLRNPFRFTMDPETNSIWIGDVGQNAREEVNRASLSQAGLNYGWRCYEGNAPFNTSGCPDESELTFPVFDYSWNGGGSVIGGYVYRGDLYADLQDVYVFGDIDGMISTLDIDDNYINQGQFPGTWVAFGQDINKELYSVNLGGSIFKIAGGVLSVDENQGANAIIYPNPATNIVSIKLQTQVMEHLKISDVKGSIIYTETLQSNQKQLNTSSFAKGMYFITITTKLGAKFVKKLMIK